MKKIKLKLKRGYSIDVIIDDPKVIGDRGGQNVSLGNYSKSNYKATMIVSVYGIAPTVRENHGQVTGIMEIKRGKNEGSRN